MNNTELLSTVESVRSLSEEQLDDVNGGGGFTPQEIEEALKLPKIIIPDGGTPKLKVSVERKSSTPRKP